MLDTVRERRDQEKGDEEAIQVKKTREEGNDGEKERTEIYKKDEGRKGRERDKPTKETGEKTMREKRRLGETEGDLWTFG